jgi:putative aldouronate transport system permease protein
VTGAPASLESPINRAGSTASPSARFGARVRRAWSRNGVLLLMALPGMIQIFVFSYLPMPGLLLAFKNYRAADGIWGSQWVGFKNFEFLFSTGDAWRIIFNTIFLNSLFLCFTIVLGSLAVAILLHEIYDHYVTRFYQSILFFPHFISFVIVGYFAFAFLNADNGLVNGLLSSWGMQPINWYGEAKYWPAILVFISMWKGIGYFAIIYLAGMLAINPEFYEAARIDGASKWQEIRFIMLPLIRPLVIINVLLAVGRIFYANFDFLYNVTRDASLLLPTVDVIDTYVFRSLTAVGNYNLASAAGFFQATVGFVLVLFANWLVRRFDTDQALF